jgi:hypothetical protein
VLAAFRVQHEFNHFAAKLLIVGTQIRERRRAIEEKNAMAELGQLWLTKFVYGDNNASVVLNDEREQAVQIFRTVGERSAPVLVMKSQGRDRIVMGLNGASQDPFLVLYGVDGAKQSVFGHD